MSLGTGIAVGTGLVCATFLLAVKMMLNHMAKYGDGWKDKKKSIE